MGRLTRTTATDHFHNAMIYGDNLEQYRLHRLRRHRRRRGAHHRKPEVRRGRQDHLADPLQNLALSGITLREGGHFAALPQQLRQRRLRPSSPSTRRWTVDGWNIISTTNVKITGAHLEANDDALAFKSDYALGAKLNNGHVDRHRLLSLGLLSTR